MVLTLLRFSTYCWVRVRVGRLGLG
jgi:hypothetical protein